VILGPQGCGKGTQGKLLARELGVTYLSTGDLFRRIAGEDSELGKVVAACLDDGRMVADKHVLEVLIRAVSAPEAEIGFVLDGYPRRANQVAELDEVISPHRLDRAIFLDASLEVARERAMSRQVCSNGDCGMTYGLVKPPPASGECDRCGAAVASRSDDTVVALDKRHQHYLEQTRPAIELYRERGLLLEIDGDAEPAVVQRAILDGLRR
jgi:adenylate kinase